MLSLYPEIAFENYQAQDDVYEGDGSCEVHARQVESDECKKGGDNDAYEKEGLPKPQFAKVVSSDEKKDEYRQCKKHRCA
ncbi:MAG: hypothetical protein ABI443_12810 [Chthoniobacterales bacterium]